MRHASHGDATPSARLFERLVRDAQGAANLAAFRSKILETLACEIGADSGTLMDPPGMRLTPSRARSRVGGSRSVRAGVATFSRAKRVTSGRSGDCCAR